MFSGVKLSIRSFVLFITPKVTFGIESVSLDK